MRRSSVELVVFVGLQASGKSTVYYERFSGTHRHVSKDLFPHNRDKNRRQEHLIRAALSTGRSVVVDNTNPSAAIRAPLIELGKRHGARILGYFFESDVQACLERNARREGRARVPEVGLFATLKLLEPPRRAEGFEALHLVRLAPEGGFLVTPLE